MLAVSRQLEISSKRLWRIVLHYVGRVGYITGGRCRRGRDGLPIGHRYVTVFLNMQRNQEPVIFAVLGHGNDTIKAFSALLRPVAAIRTMWSRSSATFRLPSSAV